MSLPFTATTDRFNTDNAYYLAHASSLAYKVKDEAQDGASKVLGLDTNFHFFDIHHDANYDTQAFAAAGPEHAVLAFRGTEPGQWKDWMTDLQATPADSQWLFSDEVNVGHVHAGFGNALADSWGEISAWLQENVISKNRSLWITGHSLGGALAVMAAAISSFDPDIALNIQGVYSYGQPRVGFRNFCSLLDRRLRSRIFRFVNNRDPVPRVPFRAFDYNHVGQMIHFGPNGVPKTDGSYWEEILKQPFTNFGAIINLIESAIPQVTDHELDEGYIKLIEANRAALNTLSFP